MTELKRSKGTTVFQMLVSLISVGIVCFLAVYTTDKQYIQILSDEHKTDLYWKLYLGLMFFLPAWGLGWVISAYTAYGNKKVLASLGGLILAIAFWMWTTYDSYWLDSSSTKCDTIGFLFGACALAGLAGAVLLKNDPPLSDGDPLGIRNENH
jgi:hypothetical protein